MHTRPNPNMPEGANASFMPEYRDPSMDIAKALFEQADPVTQMLIREDAKRISEAGKKMLKRQKY